MSQLRLYVDEDAMDGDLIRALRSSDIHTKWTVAGRSHAGIILEHQKRYSTGEEIRRLLRLIGSLASEPMRNREEFLSQW